MSDSIEEKPSLFEEAKTTIYDSKIMETASLEEILHPMIKIMKALVRNILESIRALKEVDEGIMHMMRMVSAMELLQKHFEFTAAVLETQSEEEVGDLKDNKFSLLKEYYENLKSKDDLSRVPAKYVVAMAHDKIIVELKKVLQKCFKKNPNGETELNDKDENLARVQIMTGRFELTYSRFPQVVTFPKDDIIFYEKTTPAWQELFEYATFKQIVTKQEVRATSKLFHFSVHLSHLIINNQIRTRNHPRIKTLFSLLKQIICCGFQSAKVETQALLYLLKPDVQEAFKAWNLPEQPLISRAFLLVSPMIAYDKRVFLPRLFPIIDRETIMKEYRENTINKIQPMDPKDLAPPNLGKDRCEILEEIFTERPEKVAVRILSDKNMDFEEPTTSYLHDLSQKAKRLLSKLDGKPQEPQEEKAIIIHMHGGGFVAMTSATHRIYLTRWVKNYRKSPKHKYPDAVDDVWQAYLWIINYATTVLGIKYQKVILVGDSSGATLALALMFRLIRVGLKPPHGCLLIYPALIMDENRASPSFFESLDDPLLPYTLLKLIIEAYLDKSFKHFEDPYISPLVASDELLEKLPPLRLVTGSHDPLYDDNWRFLERLKKLKKDVKITVHAYLSHGYICHKLLKNYNFFLEEACETIQELISIGS